MPVDPNVLEKAVQLADSVGSIFVATAGPDGMPHMAAANKLLIDPDGNVLVVEWFCPGTVMNLRENRRVALVIWDAAGDNGYQLLGEVTQVDELAVLDGYDPAAETSYPPPQVERQLIVRVDKIIRFSQAPHSDVAEDVKIMR